MRHFRMKEAQERGVVFPDAEQRQVVFVAQVGVTAVAVDDFTVVDAAEETVQAGCVLRRRFRAVLK
jgi:hypothetical protein